MRDYHRINHIAGWQKSTGQCKCRNLAACPGSPTRKSSRMRRELLTGMTAPSATCRRHTNDPYAIWVSEIMLQQTRLRGHRKVQRALLERFPTVEALAKAEEQDVLALWSGLGYYRRARYCTRLRKPSLPSSPEKCPTPQPNSASCPALARTPAPPLPASPAENTSPWSTATSNECWRPHPRMGITRRGRRNCRSPQSGQIRGSTGRPTTRRRLQPRHHGTGRHCLHATQSAMPRLSLKTERRTLGEHKTPKRAATTNSEITCPRTVRDTIGARNSPRTTCRDQHRDAGYWNCLRPKSQTNTTSRKDRPCATRSYRSTTRYACTNCRRTKSRRKEPMSRIGRQCRSLKQPPWRSSALHAKSSPDPGYCKLQAPARPTTFASPSISELV